MKTSTWFLVLAIAEVSMMGCSSAPEPGGTDDGGGEGGSVVDAADASADVVKVNDAGTGIDAGGGACTIIGPDVDAGQVSMSRQYGYTAGCDTCIAAKCCDAFTACFTTDDAGAKCTNIDECSNCADIFTAYGVCLSFDPPDYCEGMATDKQPDKPKFDALQACVTTSCSSVCHP
jgi:hypothetical protein